jgi:dienelactone hydrolase
VETAIMRGCAGRGLLLLLAATLFVAAGTCAFAQAQSVVEIESRGQKVRAVLLKPSNPKGAVILLAGGNGRLDIAADGTITKLRQNQLVRSRERYAQAGYATLVPDIAPDFKVGALAVAEGYRAKPAYAQDIGAAVRLLRGIVSKPVVAVGTSRGSMTAANAVAKLKGSPELRPDAAVLTSAFLTVGAKAQGLTVWKVSGQGNANLLDVPMLVAWHVADTCQHTLPSAVPPFRDWYGSNGRKLAEKSFSGGLPAVSEPCEARSPHGFYGLDSEVTTAITGWIAGL